jgi:hypothetical protein
MKDELPYGEKISAEPINVNKPGSSQVSLVFMLLLIFCAAILASLFQLSFLTTRKTPSLVMQLSFGTGLIASFIGAIVGICIELRFLSAFFGSIIGLTVGIVAGAISAIPNDYSSRLNQVAFVGSLAMIFMALLASRNTRRIDGSWFTSIREKDE